VVGMRAEEQIVVEVLVHGKNGIQDVTIIQSIVFHITIFHTVIIGLIITVIAQEILLITLFVAL
jgi:hypothetical protein